MMAGCIEGGVANGVDRAISQSYSFLRVYCKVLLGEKSCRFFVFFFPFMCMVNHIDLFLYVELSLHSGMKPI